ncbi:MAG TPA: helix-turn-helix domain-containing protein [Gammaproteobacteria bacterium]
MDAVETPGLPPLQDLNGDGRLTIGDVQAWLAELFFLPGDWLLWCLTTYTPAVGRFLEIGADDYGGVLSGFLSALLWLAALLGASFAYQGVRHVDEALTAMVVRAYAEATRRCRVAARIIAFKLKPPARRVRQSVEVSDDLELSPEEIRILRLHADVPAGYALTTSELAAKLGVRRGQVPKLLGRLERERLIARTFGGYDGETSYAITAAGSALLVFRQLLKKSPAEAGQVG